MKEESISSKQLVGDSDFVYDISQISTVAQFYSFLAKDRQLLDYYTTSLLLS